MEWLSYRGEGLVILAGLLGLVGYLTLIVAAWRLKDGTLGWSLALLPVAFGVFGLIAFSLSQADVFPSEATVISGLLAFALMPLAFTLRFAGFLWDRRLIPAVGSILVAVFLLVGALPVLSFGAQGAFRAAAVQDGRDFLIEPGVVLEGAALPAEMPEAEVVPQENGKSGEAASTSTGNQPPRLRQYFPETMLWLPDAVTDESGSLNLDIPIADSITTWRMTVLASSQDGRLGSTTAGLRVFQDFFVDLDLPPALTVGDEISVPVGVFNYLQDDQTVRLELERSDWFELLDEPVKEINIVSNDIDVVYFRVRALDFGRKLFKVTAWGSHMSDAIQKEVQVFPDGKQINFTQSDRLTPGDPVEQRVNIPAEAIPGTQTILVKIYPGVVSQVVEGLESILRMPFGCFEQTSSTTYPNVLVLDYLKSSGQASPEVQFKAEEYINLGYQRLTTFEVGGSGGFSLFGSPPADRMLTAYGLREFSDMSRVHQVDPDLVARAAEWLLSQQGRDGSWENDRGLVHENTWSNLKNDRLPVSAYIVWSLVEAGFGDDPRTVKGIAYVRERVSQADDPYVLALVANALVAADLDQGGGIDSATQAVLDRLAGMAVQEGSGVYWTSGVATFMGSQGRTGSIETTALAALAFLRADRYPDKANAALTHLIQAKDSFGTWHSTQATVLALKALIQTVRAGAESVEAEITLSLNGSQTRTIQVGSENFDVVQLVRFDDLRSGADNLVEIRAQGEGSLMYQVSGSYYLPWDKLALYRQPDQGKDLLSIDIAYDRTELSVNDTVKVDVSVALEEGNAESALIDLGVPPGFSVQVEDLSALVSSYNDVPEDYAFPTIERYELTGRQILVYVSNLSAGNPLQFSYHLQAKFPLAVQSPASNAYDYYNPDISGEAAPQALLVRQ